MPVTESQFDHLDNPALASLLTTLRPYSYILASETAIAARATLKLMPIAGYHAERQEDGFQLLRQLLDESGHIVLLVYDEIKQDALKQRFKVMAIYHPINQMVFTQKPTDWPKNDAVALDERNFAEMKALVDLTQPGLFGEESPSFGRFVGIRLDGRLVAMGGLRFQTNRAAELTVICTHPDYQRRGLGSRITATLVDGLIAEGRTPFLHVVHDNHSAISVYERLGFKQTRVGQLLMLQK